MERLAVLQALTWIGSLLILAGISLRSLRPLRLLLGLGRGLLLPVLAPVSFLLVLRLRARSGLRLLLLVVIVGAYLSEWLT